MKKKILLLGVTLLLACSSSQIKPSSKEIAPQEEITIQHEFINYSSEKDQSSLKEQKVEFYWAKPKGSGPWPVILYIHGFQEGENTPGGRDLVDYGVLKAKAEKGIVAVSMSQPGFGKSTGPRDYCGPKTQKSAISILNEIRKWPFVNPEKIALYGASRGAIVGSMVEAQDQKLAAVILVVGTYDLEASYKLLKNSKSEEMRSIALNMKAEGGDTRKDFEARSALFHANKIKTPTLILNGGKDERSGQASSVKLAEALKKNGTPVKLVIYPQFEHWIPIEERDKEIVPFLQKYLF
jgi:dipeptidyl aminopeptidase/acylaminoacyl peptidase